MTKRLFDKLDPALLKAMKKERHVEEKERKRAWKGKWTRDAATRLGYNVLTEVTLNCAGKCCVAYSGADASRGENGPEFISIIRCTTCGKVWEVKATIAERPDLENDYE